MALVDARFPIEKLYRGTLTIHEWTLVTDPETHISSEVETIAVADQPCLLSNMSIAPASSTEGVPSVAKNTKIFVAPDIPIKEGSKLVVTQDGITNTYERSGIPSVYPSHQEVSVNLMEKVHSK
jgi:hypothetical protein